MKKKIVVIFLRLIRKITMKYIFKNIDILRLFYLFSKVFLARVVIINTYSDKTTKTN